MKTTLDRYNIPLTHSGSKVPCTEEYKINVGMSMPSKAVIKVPTAVYKVPSV